MQKKLVNAGLRPALLSLMTTALGAALLAAPGVASAASLHQLANLVGSATVAATDNTAPSTPTNILSVNVTSSTVNLTWSASSDDVGVSGYTVFKDGSSIASAGSTSALISGLSPNTSYSFTVKALDSAGNSSSSSSALVVKTLSTSDAAAPSAPTGLTATTVTSTGATLCWSASTDDVGVSAYEIASGVTTAGSTNNTCAAVSNLLPSSTYTFSVKARDVAGNSSGASSALMVTTLAATDVTAPSAPGNLSWTNLKGTVTLSWTASTDDSGAAVTYDLYFGSFYLGSFYETSIAMMGFKTGTPYTFTVKARDASGNTSVASNTATVLLSPTADTTPPSAPTGVTASTITTSGMTIRWTASTDDSGTVVMYQVYTNGTAATNTFGSTSATLSSLTPNTSYTITVTALDAANNVSSPSTAITATTMGGGTDTVPPSIPTGLASLSVTDTTAVLAWNASTDGNGVAGYDVYSGTTLAGTSTIPSISVTGLTASTTYSFTVKARDTSGNVSAASTALSVSTTSITGDRDEIYPTADPSSCGGWRLVDNVCVAQYCSDDLRSESCAPCGGNTSSKCVAVSSKAGVSGKWPEVRSLTPADDWHYSRSTHFGLTNGGACAFGYYGLCTGKMNFTDPKLAANCAAFCKNYPSLCADPDGTTLRGNFAAPQGNYYTQFWPSLPGDRDNYLSCGECFELVRTHKDGTNYVPGETGYFPSVVLQILDSCPCSANSKWCCGSGRDHCAEVSDFKYGCPIPPIPPVMGEHDPVKGESIHLDLSDIAMARLQTGDANGNMIDGVIPIQYRRVSCPVVGNIHIWLKSGAGNYWFSLSVVNVSKFGSITLVEAKDAAGNWIPMNRDQNYTSSRPQERYGVWVVKQGSGPYDMPLTLRFTDPSGKQLVATDAIKSFTAPTGVDPEIYYIDTGVQF
jgi:chitodextrinase